MRNRIIESLKIERIAAEGKGMGRDNGKVVFVDYAVPGDEVEVFLTRKKKDYAMGKVNKLITPSPIRVSPFCQYFETCGGCRWQQLSYEQQLLFKSDLVEEAFTRIGKITPQNQLPILGSESDRYYRNKMEYTFSNHRWLTTEEINENEKLERNGLGLHVPGQFNKVVHIEQCYLQSEISNEIRNEAYNYALKNKLSFYNLKDHEGFLRNIIIRTSTLSEIMVIVVFAEDDREQIDLLLEHLKAKIPAITSLYFVVNKKKNDTIFDQETHLYSGIEFLHEKINDVTYSIGPKSFFQTNSRQAVRLYNTALDCLEIGEGDLVFDLYTGLGSIALQIAKRVDKVIGIEAIAEAIEDAKMNANFNEIDNVKFIAQKVEDALTQEFFAEHGVPDIVITDPPRAGMHKDVIENLLKVQPKQILYISCNPATQARDVALLSESYELISSQAVDMFPQTYHIENIAYLKLK